MFERDDVCVGVRLITSTFTNTQCVARGLQYER